MSNIHEKLFKMRDSIKKEQFSSFDELAAVIERKAKYYKVLPLYCFYGKVATLTLVNVDEITDVIKFQLPKGFTEPDKAKQLLYKMAFDINEAKATINPKQYLELTERMKELGVTEKEVLERYQIKSLSAMTEDIYQRCMRVLDNMKK